MAKLANKLAASLWGLARLACSIDASWIVAAAQHFYCRLSLSLSLGGLFSLFWSGETNIFFCLSYVN